MDISSAASQGRTVTPGMLITALLVPVVAVLGVLSSLHVEDIDMAWVHRQQAACRHMPFPKVEYVFAWAGPILGLSAMAVCLLLARWIRRRSGVRIWDTWPGLLAFVVALLNVVAILLELFMLWTTNTPDGSGSILGDCG
ncbi:hypothetical protein [Streptomyces sp. NBC_01443]|uniref:hypothetical protein n=1 Tax=Streptomyces sp. NBC_01443 TaxID=2903868 RepID=UPI00225A1FCA|nr:hypothetical protein [Streptomyces sp. NBC_01443]MCX4631104.1 hypothetical protein [Streptomyces sp. NBC_01443]